MRFRFGDFEADSARFALTRRGEPLAIEPKPLRLLLYLLSRHPATSSKEELLQALWPDEEVTEHSLTRAVCCVRRALGQASRQAGVIRSVRGRGYGIGVGVERACDHAAAPISREDDLFVGREDVLTELREAFASARAGRGRVALLAGEPGIGKTRTAEVLARHAEAQGAEVVWARALEGGGAPALWPWLQALRSLAWGRDAATLRAELGSGAAQVAALLPEVRERLPRLAPPPRTLSGEVRFRCLDAVAQWLVRVSAERPLVLVFDDLDCADAPSLELFGFAANELRGARTLLLGTYRHVAARPNQAMDELIAGLARLPAARPPIRLSGLGLEEVERLAAFSSSRQAAPAWVRRVHERSDGNPFLVRELLRLGESGEISARVPPAVHAVVRRRLESLGEEVRALLETASVLGRVVPVELLERALGARTTELWGWLEEAERAGFLEPLSEGRAPGMRFVHALLQETVLAEIPRRRRMALQRRVRGALAQLHAGEPEPRLPALGRPSGGSVQEILFANRETMGILGEAHGAGQEDLVLEARRQRIALFLEIGDAELLDAEIERFALESARAGIRSERHHAASYLAMRATQTGRFPEARIWIDAAETLADPSDPKTSVVTPLTQRLLLPVGPEGGHELERVLRELIVQCPALPHWRTALARYRYEAGRDAEAAEVLDRILADDLLAVLGPDVGWLSAAVCVAQLCAGLGRRDAAGRLFELLEPYARYNVVIGLGVGCLGPVSLYLGELATLLGRDAEAERHLDAALERTTRLGARPWRARTHLARARWRLAQRALGAARPELEAAAGSATALGMEVLRARAEHLLD